MTVVLRLRNLALIHQGCSILRPLHSLLPLPWMLFPLVINHMVCFLPAHLIREAFPDYPMWNSHSHPLYLCYEYLIICLLLHKNWTFVLCLVVSWAHSKHSLTSVKLMNTLRWYHFILLSAAMSSHFLISWLYWLYSLLKFLPIWWVKNGIFVCLIVCRIYLIWQGFLGFCCCCCCFVFWAWICHSNSSFKYSESSDGGIIIKITVKQ